MQTSVKFVKYYLRKTYCFFLTWEDYRTSKDYLPTCHFAILQHECNGKVKAGLRDTDDGRKQWEIEPMSRQINKSDPGIVTSSGSTTRATSTQLTILHHTQQSS
jgi:hypothetical protein